MADRLLFEFGDPSGTTRQSSSHALTVGPFARYLVASDHNIRLDSSDEVEGSTLTLRATLKLRDALEQTARQGFAHLLDERFGSALWDEIRRGPL